MSIRLQITLLVYMMVQAVMFGIGAILVLATPLAEQAMVLMPWMIAATAVLAAPLSWWLAPRLRLRFWRDHRA